jgi:sulfur-oxidizing protein SoxY
MTLRSILAVAVSLACTALLSPAPALAQDEATWREIRANVVGDREPDESTGLLTVVAPKRAEDAAIVPLEVHIRLPDGDPRRIAKLTLVVDENPAPVVGTFTFADDRSAFDISTRVRVNSYSYARAIVETSDGRLFMAKSYIKAAGGCSAPAAKDPVEAKTNLGQMRFRTFPDRQEAQIQIRHPNYSGLQMDQTTRLYTPAWFIESLTVRKGERPLFSMTGGISISEDPSFRFSYAPNGEPVTVEARDTEGRVFKQTFPGSGAS